MLEVVLDTETTGLSVSQGHRIVEIGCVELKDLIPTNKIFHCYLNPERKVSEDALKVHGYTDEFLSKQKKFADIADEFLNFIKGKQLIIHNAEFDLAHLNNELSILGKSKINENYIDTLELAKEKFPGSGVSLDALCKKFNIDNSRRKTHTALIDCELLSNVYINLLDQKEPTLKLEEDNSSNEKESIGSNINHYKKIIHPSEEEILLHKKFIKSEIKKNYFN